MANATAENSRKAKPRGKPFAKGTTGNAGGRPKLPDDVKHVRELAREYTAEAIAALAGVMTGGSGPAKVAAANALLDRGWGKPSQPVDGDGEGGAIQHSITVHFVQPK